MSEQVKIGFAYEFPLVHCDECSQEFVVMAVMRGTNYEGDGEAYQTVYQLAKTQYCPFCGREDREEVAGVVQDSKLTGGAV